MRLGEDGAPTPTPQHITTSFDFDEPPTLSTHLRAQPPHMQPKPPQGPARTEGRKGKHTSGQRKALSTINGNVRDTNAAGARLVKPQTKQTAKSCPSSPKRRVTFATNARSKFFADDDSRLAGVCAFVRVKCVCVCVCVCVCACVCVCVMGGDGCVHERKQAWVAGRSKARISKFTVLLHSFLAPPPPPSLPPSSLSLSLSLSPHVRICC